MSARSVAKKIALSGTRAMRIHDLVRSRLGGVGVIFTSHRVIEPEEIVLDPSQAITTHALSLCIEHVRRSGYDIISLDQLLGRLTQSPHCTNFVCFTFDDGYRDNLTLGLPIFRRYAAPLCVYVSTGLADRRIYYWWRGLERLVLRHDMIKLNTGSGIKRLPARSLAEKRAAYAGLCKLVTDGRQFDVGKELFASYGIDPALLLDEDTLSWAELATLARDPLVTIGAHTVSHPMLSNLDDASAKREMEQSKTRLEAMLGLRVDHFAYPFGDSRACGNREYAFAREVGFKTAVTTQVCNIFRDHSRHLWSLPRISLDNTAARSADIDLHLSGVTAAFRMRLHHPVISRHYA